MVRTLLILGMLSTACGTGTKYKHYVVGNDFGTYEGTLYGPEEKDDIPFSRCKPDDLNKGKCIVVELLEFERILSDVDRMEKMLRACQAGM